MTRTIYDHKAKEERICAAAVRDWLDEHPDVREWFDDMIWARPTSPGYVTIIRTDANGEETDLEEWCVEGYV